MKLFGALLLVALLCGAARAATPGDRMMPCDNVPAVTRASAADMAYATHEDVLLSVWTTPNGAVMAMAYDSKALAPIWREAVVVDADAKSNPLGAGPQAIYSPEEHCFWIVYDAMVDSYISGPISAVFMQRLDLKFKLLPAPAHLSLPVGAPAPAPTPIVNFNPLLEWNTLCLSTIATLAANPPTASRAIAMVFVAAYDAVNSITKRNAPYYGFVDQSASPPALTNVAMASMEAAIAKACRDVLVALWPAQTTTFDAKLGQHLAMIPDGAAKTDGIALGAASAATVIAARATDGFASAGSGSVPALVNGDWISTPPAFLPPMLPSFGNVVPWTLTSAVAFRAMEPPRLGQPEYEAENREVLRLGNMTSRWRTPEQTNIALLWAAGGGTVTPPGLWMQVAAQMVLKRALPTDEATRLLALMGMALSDAAIVAWETKYFYHNWRPVTALRFSAADGDDNTYGDAQFLSLLATPPFPAYISGHSTFSAAGAAVLAGFFRDDNAVFSVSSDGLTRSFTSFSGAAAEAGMSRIYGGIHFQADNRHGQATGRSIGENALSWLAPREMAANPAGALNADGQLLVVYAGTTVMDLGCLVWSLLIEGQTVSPASPNPNKLFCAAGATASAITAAIAADIRPTVAYSAGTDSFVAAWSMGSLGAHHLGGIIVVLMNGLGVPEGAPQMIADLPVTPYTGAVAPSVVFSEATDDFVVVWCGQIRGAGITDLYGQRLTVTDSGSGKMMLMGSMTMQLTNTHDDVPAHKSMSPSVHVDGEGYLACWTGDGNNYQVSPGVFCQRLDAELMLVGEPVIVTSPRAGEAVDQRSQAQVTEAGHGKWAVLFTTGGRMQMQGGDQAQNGGPQNGGPQNGPPQNGPPQDGGDNDEADEDERRGSQAGVQATLLNKDLMPLPAVYCVRRRAMEDDDDEKSRVAAITVPVVVGGTAFLIASGVLVYAMTKAWARYAAERAVGKAKKAGKASRV